MIFIFFHIYFEARIMTTGLNVALTLLYQYLKKNLSIQLYFSTYRQKSIFEVPITVFNYFFLKNYWWYRYEHWNWQSHMYKELSTKFREKSLQNLHYFFKKINLLPTGTCTFVAITQKLKLLWQNLLGNYHSPI